MNELYWINQVNTSKVDQKTHSTTNNQASTPASLGLEQKNVLVDLAEKLGITPDQLNSILSKNTNFMTLSFEEQQKLVAELNVSKVSNEEIVENETVEPIKESVVEDKKDASQLEKTAENFNYKEFSELPLREQFDTYAEELAKNRFILGNKHNLSEWSGLSKEERTALINAERNNLNAGDEKFAINSKRYEKRTSTVLQSKMETLQVANYNNMSLDDFLKLELKERKGQVHDYKFNVVSEHPENCSESQKNYYKEQEFLSAAIVDALKRSGDPYWQNNETTFVLPESELKDYAKKLGKPIALIEYEYLRSKDNLSNYEKSRFEKLKRYDTPAGQELLEAQQNPQNYGRLDELSKSDFGEDWAAVQNASSEEKMFVLQKYFGNKMKSFKGDKEAATKFANEFISELSGIEPILAGDLVAKGLERLERAERKAIIQGADKTLQSHLSIGINDLPEDLRSDFVKLIRAKESKDPDFIEKLGLTITANSKEETLVLIKDEITKFKNEKVVNSYTDAALDKTRVSAEGQNKIFISVFENASDKSAAYAAKNLDKTYKENQLSLTVKASERKACNDAMIEDGTIARFAKENQTEAFKIQKTRCEQDDYTKDEAIEQLNKLSDLISKCDKDNQLDMHNEIMKSKYSEVQEHAAGNIKNYDPSVQADAMNTVYKSGNQKAIEAAVSSIPEFKSPDMQRQETVRAVGEIVLNDKNAEPKAKFLAGELTYEEVKNLPISQRREIFQIYFKKLPMSEKIKLLSSIKNFSTKKTVYAMIARNNDHLFSEICKDKDCASDLLSMGLPVDVVNKVKSYVSFYAVADIGFQGVAKKYDIEWDGMNEEYPPTAKTLDYTSLPETFNNEKYNMFVRDKRGNLLA